MLTLFSIPKPFDGHIGLIQNNALGTWTRLDPRPQIVLFGDEPGVQEAAARYGAVHVPDVTRNEYGTPLLDGVFDQADRLAAGGLLCYVNTDILLFQDLVVAVRRCDQMRRKFLLIGRRWDLDVDTDLDFSEGWSDRVRRRARERGTLHGPEGLDWFAYRPGLFGEIPPFAVGRTAWDNWLLYRARCLGARLIDGTDDVMVVHQNHDYGVQGGKNVIWTGPEARRNWELAGGPENAFSAVDATWRLHKGRFRPILLEPPLRRRLVTLHRVRPGLRWLLKPLILGMDATYPLRLRLGMAHLGDGRVRNRARDREAHRSFSNGGAR